MSIFAKRHYVFLADMLGRELAQADSFRMPDGAWRVAAYEELTRELIRKLRNENPNFKPERFSAHVAKARKAPSTDAG